MKAKKEKAGKVLAAAEKAFKAVGEVSPDMVWRSVVRTGEMERRIQQCGKALTDLEKEVSDGNLKDDPLVTDLIEHMPHQMEAMSDLKDMCRDLRGCTHEHLVKEIVTGEGTILDTLAHMFGGLFNSDWKTLGDMINMIAKKLQGASWLRKC